MVYYAFQDIHRERTYIKNYLPPVLPNGWIPVLESSKLKVNTVKTLNVIGEWSHAVCPPWLRIEPNTLADNGAEIFPNQKGKGIGEGSRLYLLYSLANISKKCGK